MAWKSLIGCGLLLDRQSRHSDTYLSAVLVPISRHGIQASESVKENSHPGYSRSNNNKNASNWLESMETYWSLLYSPFQWKFISNTFANSTMLSLPLLLFNKHQTKTLVAEEKKIPSEANRHDEIKLSVFACLLLLLKSFCFSLGLSFGYIVFVAAIICV